MNIPDKAVEAAARAHLAGPWDTYSPGDQEYHLEVARTSLDAAAPFIAAQALRDAAEEFGDDTWESVWAAADVDDDVSAVQATTAWMRTIADDMEDGQ